MEQRGQKINKKAAAATREKRPADTSFRDRLWELALLAQDCEQHSEEWIALEMEYWALWYQSQTQNERTRK